MFFKQKAANEFWHNLLKRFDSNNKVSNNLIHLCYEMIVERNYSNFCSRSKDAKTTSHAISVTMVRFSVRIGKQNKKTGTESGA